MSGRCKVTGVLLGNTRRCVLPKGHGSDHLQVVPQEKVEDVVIPEHVETWPLGWSERP